MPEMALTARGGAEAPVAVSGAAVDSLGESSGFWLMAFSFGPVWSICLRGSMRVFRWFYVGIYDTVFPVLYKHTPGRSREKGVAKPLVCLTLCH